MHWSYLEGQPRAVHHQERQVEASTWRLSSRLPSSNTTQSLPFWLSFSGQEGAHAHHLEQADHHDDQQRLHDRLQQELGGEAIRLAGNQLLHIAGTHCASQVQLQIRLALLQPRPGWHPLESLQKATIACLRWLGGFGGPESCTQSALIAMYTLSSAMPPWSEIVRIVGE